MKVAIFSRYPSNPDTPRGGVEAVTAVLVRALAEAGQLDLHVVTLEPGRRQGTIESRDGVTIHRLVGSRWPQIADVLAGPGKSRLIKCLLSLRPDVIHAHETHGLALGELPVPCVFTIHGFDHENLLADAAWLGRLRSRLWRLVQRRGLTRQRHIISITPYVRRLIEPLTRAKIYDIDNPVDERFFAVRRAAGPPRVLCVGWLNNRKNPLGAVAAFALAVRRGTKGRLVFAGAAKTRQYHDRLLSCIRSHGLSDRVELLGHVSRDRLLAELGRAGVFLLPSRQENSPMAIAEALAAGVPVIASDRCGMPYMVEHWRTGFLVDPEDTRAIAARIQQLLTNSDLRQRMSKQARRTARARWHPRTVAAKTIEVYRAAIGN